MTVTQIYIALALAFGGAAIGYTAPEWSDLNGAPGFTFGQTLCKKPVVHVSMATNSRARAETRALIGWQKKAINRYGDKFSHWHNASRRKIDCVQVKYRMQKCTIKATPCPTHAAAPQPPQAFY